MVFNTGQLLLSGLLSSLLGGLLGGLLLLLLLESLLGSDLLHNLLLLNEEGTENTTYESQIHRELTGHAGTCGRGYHHKHE